MKKAELSMSVLIKMILGLVVLIIMSMIFWNYSNNSADGMKDTKDDTISHLTDGKCDFPGTGGKCVTGSCPEGYESSTESKCDDGETCCKKKNEG